MTSADAMNLSDVFHYFFLPFLATTYSFKYFSYHNIAALYSYDFGDGWRHVIAFEAFLQPEKNVQYPCCLSGERKCPPEDCGGPGGYWFFLEAIRDVDHEEHERYLTWYGGEFDPDEFDPAQVQFDDPAERWRIAFIDP